MGTFGIEAGKAAIQAGSGILGSLMGVALGGYNDRRQVMQQERLNALATRSNKEIAAYNNQLQMDLWNKTNYEAQMQHMENAGLNPGMMYGMSGGGGATASANPAQGVSTAQAPSGGGEALGMGITAMQQQMTMAQIELAKSQANKNNVEAAKTAGVDTQLTGTQIQSLTQGIQNQKAIEKLTKIQTDLSELDKAYKEATLEQSIANYANEASRIMSETKSAMAQADVDASTVNNRIIQVKATLMDTMAGIALKHAQHDLARSGITLNDAQITNMQEQIKLGNQALIQQLSISNKQLGQAAEIDGREYQEKVLNQALQSGNMAGNISKELGEKILQALTLGGLLKNSGIGTPGGIGFKPQK